MNYQRQALAAGLYLVSTPIGTARDITLRALDVLASADILVAEDTRSLKRLLGLHGVPVGGRPLWSYHDHSGAAARDGIVAAIAGGASVAYASEAGTPMVSDPGYALARAVGEAGHVLTAAPGASAVIVALTLSGLPTDRFLFLGFAPAKAAGRRRLLTEIAGVPATLVFFESPRRVREMLGDMVDLLGEDREAAMCRELTKRFEDVIRAPLGALAERVSAAGLKGECVLVVGPPVAAQPDAADLQAALRRALSGASLRDAAAEVAAAYGVSRKSVYALGLKMADAEGRE